MKTLGMGYQSALRWTASCIEICFSPACMPEGVKMGNRPKSPEFDPFTGAMPQIMTLSKTELNRRIEAEERKTNASASPVSANAPKRERQKGSSVSFILVCQVYYHQ